MSENEIYDRLRAIENTNSTLTEKIKGVLARIDEQKQLTDTVHKLALSVERLVYGQEQTRKDVDALRCDVTEIKARPARRWETVITALITAAVAFLVGKYT